MKPTVTSGSGRGSVTDVSAMNALFLLSLAHPEMRNSHPTLLLEQSPGCEETRYRQILVFPRFHVKHGKWRLHRYRNCVRDRIEA